MAKFLNTLGNPTLGVGLCDRCKRKFPIGELRPDGDSPGLLVCRDDWDMRGKDKLPIRKPESITLRVIRPETDIARVYVLDTDGLPVADEYGYYTEA